MLAMPLHSTLWYFQSLLYKRRKFNVKIIDLGNLEQKFDCADLTAFIAIPYKFALTAFQKRPTH